MISRRTRLGAAGLVMGLVAGAVALPAQASETGTGGTLTTAARTVQPDGAELQRIRASVRARGRVLRSTAALLATAEVPGDVTDVEKRTRLGVPTWRVLIEMESGYKVAAFVHRRSGVIVDWTVLAVPADVDYIPPKKDSKRPDLDAAQPKPAPIPAILVDAIDAERKAPMQEVTAPSPTPLSSPSTPASTSHADDDSDEDSAEHSRDVSGDDRRGDHSSDGESDDQHDADERDSGDDSGDDSRESSSSDDDDD